MAKAIGTIGNVPSLLVNGTTFVDIVATPVIQLFGSTDGATNVRSNANKIGSQSNTPYQITTGKTLTIYAAQSEQHGSAGGSVNIGQVDNNTTGLQSSTAFTNPVFFGSEGTSTGHPLYYVTATAGARTSKDLRGTVVATKYVGIQASATANLTLTHMMWGYEA